ncbi:pre-mRNA cleavage complex 2 protein Pcf11-like [Cryptotermes secundus]|uniref:pre-mRNA cleavage complex 2 protein Pcf11-like n=1 Tax=Cryptotermes secundus TaxID=105785 RepID=UPI000CD7D12A|nr:pre-mRNA cleavage complex 2 protein Pcf11-like [Cryptotermes secundus]
MTPSDMSKAASLLGLTKNSKRMIDMLSVDAHKNIRHAPIIVETLEKHLQKVDKKTQTEMFLLRRTWKKVFPPKKLYVDICINAIDPAWPITAVPPTTDVNPKCFRQAPPAPNSQPPAAPPATPAVPPSVRIFSSLNTPQRIIKPTAASTILLLQNGETRFETNT